MTGRGNITARQPGRRSANRGFYGAAARRDDPSSHGPPRQGEVT